MQLQSSNCCKAGLNALKIEALLALNLMGGPWQGAGNLGKLHGAMEHFLSTQSPEHPLFQACYPLLTETKHLNVFPFNYGSAEHQQEVWQWVKTLPIWFRKFEVVKSGRWHNFTSKSSRLEKYSGAVFFAILVFGFAEQWYKSIYETPLGGASFSNIMGDDDDGDDSNTAAASSSSKAPHPHGDPAPAGMKQSEAQFQRTKLSKKFKSNLQMCLWWLGDRCRRCTAIMMGKVAYPLLKAHGERLRGRPGFMLCVRVCKSSIPGHNPDYQWLPTEANEGLY